MSSFLSVKRIILLAFFVVVLIAIPLTIYLIKQQKSQVSLTPTATLSLSPSSQSITVGQNTTFNVTLDPGTNQVSQVKLYLLYDATKLATTGAGFVPNSSAFPSIISGPTYSPGTITVTLSVGQNGQIIQNQTTVGTVSLTGQASTDTAPTQINFGQQTQILPAGSTTQSVLASTSPSNVTIAGAVPTPTPVEVPVAVAVPTLTPTPTPDINSAIIPTDTPIPADTVTLDTPTPTPSQIAYATLPICSSLTANPTQGYVPFNVNYTLVGSSTNSTITQVNFDYGDGQTQTITQGTGGSAVNILQNHVYNSQGTFTATATLTDANGNVSTVGSCTVVITVGAASTATPANTATSSAIAQVTTLPQTGPNNIILLGALGAVLLVIGAVLLIAL